MSVSTAAAVGDRVVHKEFPPITRHTLALYCGASGDHTQCAIGAYTRIPHSVMNAR